jgi:aspartate kinase
MAKTMTSWKNVLEGVPARFSAVCALLYVERLSRVERTYLFCLVSSIDYFWLCLLTPSGFFGAMPGSLIKSVSRGYSDLCAALCAVAIGAEELQIWKEVDGIFTADPRKIQSARLLATVTTEEAAELTYYGSEVIHFLTIEQIDAAGISLRLKNVMNPEGAGTIIHPSQKADSAQILPGTPNLELVTESNTYVASSKIAFMTANGYYGASHYRRKPTAVTVVGQPSNAL